MNLHEDYPMETDAFFGFLTKAESGKAPEIKQKELINPGCFCLVVIEDDRTNKDPFPLGQQ